jgi:hypothetical protein
MVQSIRNVGDANPQATDQSLLRLLRNGDQQAATQIYRRYAKRLEALAR